jgi:hypothetical protein
MTLPPEYEHIIVADFEFNGEPGCIPTPECVVSRDLVSGEELRIWLGDGAPGADLKAAPYPLGEDDLYVAFYASAEMSCHLALGWPLPTNLLDLYAEHRTMTNGILGIGNGLLDVCDFRGVVSTTSREYKEQMRNFILAKGPFTATDKMEILEYCHEDVKNTSDLYNKMLPHQDWPRALFRGEYMKTISRMEHRGIPIDTETLGRLQSHWQELQLHMVADVDSDYGCYDGTTFKQEKFAKYLQENGINWPPTPTGKLSTDDDTFKVMVKTYPKLQGLRDLKYLLSSMKLNSLAVGIDGRNRALLSPFRAITGRNQPSSSKFIFGPAVWLRCLIKPEPGSALLYVDYAQEEFAVAAHLSGDANMLRAYSSMDPYMDFAVQSGAAPEGATKKTHGPIRELYKQCVLAIQYGMGSQSLAIRLNIPPVYAHELLQRHHRVFKVYWEWSDRILTDAQLRRSMSTSFGWRYQVNGTRGENSKSLRNWPVQSHGADILRVACVLLDQEEIEVVAPVHDAVLIQCQDVDTTATAARTIQIMQQASEHVLGEGRVVRAECEKVVSYPDRYRDVRGAETWERVSRILSEICVNDMEVGT